MSTDGRHAENNSRTWTPYIAKVARKWYPNESITEHLLNRLGFALGVTVANSRLAVDDEFGRLRFLSEYFLRPDERLEHGAKSTQVICQMKHSWKKLKRIGEPFVTFLRFSLQNVPYSTVLGIAI